MAGGVCKQVPLILNPTTGKWTVDFNLLEAAISSKTKILLINTPHNPTGKVFTQYELEQIAIMVRKNPQLTVVMDEVYEKLVFDGRTHVRFAGLPDMWERTISVSSCGKTFSATGWKVGWAYGHADLIKPIILTNQWIQFCVSAPTQRALVKILKRADEPYDHFNTYYDFVCNQYERKRDNLFHSLQQGNLNPYNPEGGYFIIADTSKYVIPQKYLDMPGPSGEKVTRDWGFARSVAFTAIDFVVVNGED